MNSNDRSPLFGPMSRQGVHASVHRFAKRRPAAFVAICLTVMLTAASTSAHAFSATTCNGWLFSSVWKSVPSGFGPLDHIFQVHAERKDSRAPLLIGFDAQPQFKDSHGRYQDTDGGQLMAEMHPVDFLTSTTDLFVSI